MLPCFWLAVLALTLALYTVLGGYDIGVGILSGFAGRRSELRDRMAASISPLWDGNGTWLIVAGTVLFGAFPAAYSILLSALYQPLAVMLAGLVLRGVAIEFRPKAVASRWVWDLAFCTGSLLAALMQGVAVGLYAQGVPVAGQEYSGNGHEWLSAFPLGCGVVLALGYALMGASWLALKGEGELLAFARAAVRRLAPLVMLGAALVFVTTVELHPQVAERWVAHPSLLVLPALDLVSLLLAFRSASRPAAPQPFAFIAAASVLLLLSLAVSYVPYLVPFRLTLTDLAAPESSQRFMFWGAGLFALPLVVAYTWVVHAVFRGKVRLEDVYH